MCYSINSPITFADILREKVNNTSAKIAQADSLFQQSVCSSHFSCGTPQIDAHVVFCHYIIAAISAVIVRMLLDHSGAVAAAVLQTSRVSCVSWCVLWSMSTF